ncbi:MAG: hypothetical protein HY076_09015 [Candidatus Eisenbacteria bacterium]|uniref:Uncharacterized protein n=1 Tax=Eiseniibacteriota bacterium TaxID=2212470 RepID=A0A9D6QN49_UNCEI|nr:hypothetical protein [Candidatus Eisenbacteria bacterium]MBI3540398.1 hypothetical protein [Candidatus Eisenbacteria bacterium]
MRKFFALMMVAVLALAMSLALVSCTKKAEETPSTSAAPSSAPAMSDSSSTMAPADTTHK